MDSEKKRPIIINTQNAHYSGEEKNKGDFTSGLIKKGSRKWLGFMIGSHAKDFNEKETDGSSVLDTQYDPKQLNAQADHYVDVWLSLDEL